MRINQTTLVIALSSLLSACGGSDSSGPTDEDPPRANVATSTGESSIIDIWSPAALGDVRTLKARLVEGADVNALDPSARMTALAFAANFGQNAAIRTLLEAGADPNVRNGNGSTPALGTALFGRPDCLETLLDAGADPDLADENGTTTFIALTVPWEMTKGIADLFSMPLDQKSLESGREGCWKLLGPGVDIWMAAATGETTALKARIAEGIDPNAPDPVGYTTPLAIAANRGQLEAVMILLEAGADPNARNRNDSTPALGAAFFGKAECLEALLDAGADPSLADETGTTTFTALLVPWQITKLIADALMMPLDEDSLNAGRRECGRILESR